IDATGVNNLTIANVCLTTTNTDGITFGIDFTNTTNSIIRDSTITVNAISNINLLKKSLKSSVKENSQIIITDDNLSDYGTINQNNFIQFQFFSATEDTDLIINLSDKYSKSDLGFFWFVFDSYKLNIQVLSEHNSIQLMSMMNPVTIHDTYLPKTMVASNDQGFFKNCTFLEVDNTGYMVGTFENTIFIADNENIEVLSYKQTGNPDMCNKQYSDFFDETNLLKNSVVDGTTIIIRYPGINKYSNPMIINKAVNITGTFDATWNGDITFVSGSEGSNLTDMTLNGTVYINTTNIGLYNNTINKGVVIKDSAESNIEDNTFNTEDVAITLVNTIQTNIQNNDITSQAEYAIALDGDSIENTITKNIIYSADKEGNDAVNGDTTTNTISANKPGPVIFTLTDSTWSEFFNDDGTAKDIVEAGAELRFDGVFNNRDMVISVPLNLTTAETQAVLNNCTFFIDSDGVNVTNIQMNANNIEIPLIMLEDALTTRIEGNIITLTNDGNQFTHAIDIDGGENNIIKNNIITTTGPENNIKYNKPGTNITQVNTLSIQALASDGLIIDNNTITTRANTQAAEATGTIYGVYVTGKYETEYDEEWDMWESEQTPVSDIEITNNIINTESKVYAYGLTLNHAILSLVENNNVTTTTEYYANAIQSIISNSTISSNNVTVKSNNLTYGIIVAGFMDYGSYDVIIVQNNEVTNNIVEIDETQNAWGIEVYIAKSNLVENNDVIINADNGVGIGLGDSENGVVTNNHIDITATVKNSGDYGDTIYSYTSGVKICPTLLRVKAANNNTVTFNDITITAPIDEIPAVNVTSDDNTITDNYLLSPAGRGDKAVADTGEDNTIENNIPDYRLTDDTYSFYFDENGILKEEYNNTEIPIYGDFTENTQFIFEGVNVTIKADDFATLHDSQIITGNGATVVLDGITIMNKDMDAIYFESKGNVIKNSIIFVNSSMPLHLIEFAGDENTITNSIITAYIPSADVAYDKDYVGLPQSSALYISSNNNTVENVGVVVNGAEVAEGSYYPSIDAIDFQSTGKGVVIENNTITNSKVIATGSNYVYGINVG
ncbi:right-handed parallel beta-helix repeat-containing protein, partial [Methanosphaera sp.]|uniref:right-handed parallel beta-helix repeat-containing protein n=1 Tax=Methanosphaera sp. TaxID=2666342 RepID=UPI0025DF7845